MAVERLPDTELEIYGKLYEDFPTADLKHSRYMGQVSQDELFRKMEESDLFVLNSVFETFSLAVIEALNCGCSVLVSARAGVTGILNAHDCDMIQNPNDVEEIRAKIEYLLTNPNNRRLLSGIDRHEYTTSNQIKKLKEYCLQAYRVKWGGDSTPRS